MSNIDPTRISTANLANPTVERPERGYLGDQALRGVQQVASFGARMAAGGPAAMLVEGAGRLLGGGGSRDAQLDAAWQMQSDAQSFQLEMLSLQQAVQADNREFSTLSNLIKARHDTAKAAINNIRV